MTEELRQWRRSQEQNELVAGERERERERDRRRSQYRTQVSALGAGDSAVFKNNSLNWGGWLQIYKDEYRV